MKLTILTLLLFINYSSEPSLWENLKNWYSKTYETFFPNTPKTAKERIDWANSVYKKAIISNDSLLLAEAYYLYGKYEFGVNKNYLKAKLWFLKSLWIQEERGPSYELARLNFSLGHNELLNNNYHQSLVYFQKARSVAEASNVERAKVGSYTRLAGFYSDGSDIYSNSENKSHNPYLNRDSALFYLQLAETSAKKLGDAGILTSVKLTRQSLSENATPSEVLENDVKAISPKEAKSTLKVVTILKLAESYMKEGQWEKAHFQLIMAEKAHEEISYSPNLQRAIDLTYIHYFEKIGEWEKAFHLLRKIKTEDQKLLAKERNGAVSDLKKSFESEQKEIVLENQSKELEMHRENIQLQNRFLWAITSLSVFSVIVALLFYLLNRKNRQISQQNALLVKEQNHRFNNNLQTISSLLTLKSNELATHDAKTVLDESKLLIQSISSLQSKLYSADKLVSVDLQHLIPEIVTEVITAFNVPQVKTNFDIKSIVVYADDALSLSLIFTELSINACKYAFTNHQNPTLNVSIKNNQETIQFTFSDNGKEPIPETSTQNFGLFLIRSLVKQLRGTYKSYFKDGVVFEMSCKMRMIS